MTTTLDNPPPESLVSEAAACEFFTAAAKTVRAMNLYEGKGESVQRFVADLERTAENLLAHCATVAVDVRADGFYLRDMPLERAEEGKQGIAYEMFADGIRRLTFLQGIDRTQLVDFVDVLRVRRKDLDAAGHDMVTHFHARGFRHLRILAVDTFVERTDDTQMDLIWPAANREGAVQIRPEDRDVIEAANPLSLIQPDAVGAESPSHRFSTASNFGAESPSLRSPTASSNLQSPTSNLQVFRRWLYIWRESLAQSAADAAWLEDLIRTGIELFLHECQGGRLDGVRALLGTVASMARRSQRLADFQSHFTRALARPEHLQPFLLRASMWTAEWVECLAPLLKRLPEETLPALAECTGAVPDSRARDLLLSLLDERGIDVTTFYQQRLHSDDPDEVIAAVENLLGKNESLPPDQLVLLLHNEHLAVREAVLRRLGHTRSAFGAIAACLKDPLSDPAWLETLLGWVEDARSPVLIPALVAFAGRLDPQKQPDLLRRTWRCLLAFGRHRVHQPLADVLGRSAVRRHADERKLSLLAAMAEDGRAEWAELLQPLTRGWLKRGPIPTAAAAALKTIQRKAASQPAPGNRRPK